MHPSARQVADALQERGVTGQVRELPDPAPTAVTAAAQLGCEVGAIANSLVFSADGAPLLVLTSGAHRVDTGKVAVLVGAGRVKRADPEFVREATGQVIGGGWPRSGTRARCARWSISGWTDTTSSGPPPGTRTRCSPPRSPSWCASPVGPPPTWGPATRPTRPARPAAR